MQYCFHIGNYLAGTKRVSAKCVFLYWDFINRILSAGIFLQTEVSLSADICAESIICASHNSGKTEVGLAKSVDIPEESLFYAS